MHVEARVEPRVQQQPVAERSKQRGDRIGRGVGEDRAALLLGAMAGTATAPQVLWAVAAAAALTAVFAPLAVLLYQRK